jgi:LPLT family lysophospholipid transporter-like MFS transporter
MTVLVILPVVMGLLIGAGFAAGLFLIPLNAALQAESDPSKLGKTIAVQNFCDNLGMVLAGLLVFVCVKAHLSASQVFLVLAVMVAAALTWLRFPASVKEEAKG